MSSCVGPGEINEGTATLLNTMYAATKMDVLTGKDIHCMLLS